MTNWPLIRTYEGLLKVARGKENYRRSRLEKSEKAGKTAWYWFKKHQAEKNKNAAAKNWEQIATAKASNSHWKAMLSGEESRVHDLRSKINALKPKGEMWHMGGWVRPSEPHRMQRIDQGQDFEIPLYHSVVAPGDGYCTTWASDRPFPNGFGNPYAVVRITTGKFAGHEWYLGHANEPIIRPGQHFKAGQPLARLNHSLNSGWGWIELGKWPPGGMGEGDNWHYLFTDTWKA